MLAPARNRQSLRNGPEAKAVDAWLRKALGTQFNDTLAEDVPSDLASLALRFGQ